HPEDFERVEKTRAQTFSDQWVEPNIEYRIVRSDGEVRWIEKRNFISYDSKRRPQRVVGVVIDITQRKRAELAPGWRNVQVALAGKAGLVVSYASDVNTAKMQVSEGYAAIRCLREGSTETMGGQCKARVRPEDLERVEKLRAQTFADQGVELTL